MKFRATISERGIQMLHRFIPTLERFGKRADLFLSEEDLSLIMQEKDTQGAQLVVMIQAGVLWVPGSLVLESRHQNLIATEVDLEQLGKVFQGAIKHAAEQVQVKLSLLEIKASPAGPAAKKPSLSFQLPGEQLRLTQELPVGKPHPSSRINELVACKNHFHPLSWYLDIGAQVSDLQPIVEQLKRVSPTVTLGIAKSGSLYLEVDSGGLFLGSEISHLPVCPDQGAGQRFTPTATSAHTRLAEAVEVTQDPTLLPASTRAAHRPIYDAGVPPTPGGLRGARGRHYVPLSADPAGQAAHGAGQGPAGHPGGRRLPPRRVCVQRPGQGRRH